MNYRTKAGLIRVLLATTSEGKIRQYKELLNEVWPKYRKYIRLYTLKSNKFLKSLPTVDENGCDYTVNAINKAYLYGKRSGMVTISDDAGVEVYALNHKPGVFSHRCGWNPETVFVKMLDIKNRNAMLFTTVAFYDPIKSRGVFFDNAMPGSIVDHAQLLKNVPYGYDGIFAPKGSTFSIQYLLDNRFDTRISMNYPRAMGFSDVISELKALIMVR